MSNLQLQRYVKTWAALIGGAITSVLLTLPDGHLKNVLIPISAALTAIAVFTFPNTTVTPAPDLSVQEPDANAD